jgi:uncharacterized protein
MNSGVLLDTGPLVAYLYPRDRYHDWAVDQFTQLASPFISCEPVVTAVSYPSA